MRVVCKVYIMDMDMDSTRKAKKIEVEQASSNIKIESKIGSCNPFAGKKVNSIIITNE